MKLSIILPVYQAADTLERCVSSVLSQSFRDLQLILVDDASTDGSYDLCCRIKAKDPRVIVLRHTHNRGLSAARNTGLGHACGTYIMFVDADDVIADETLAVLMTTMGVHQDYDILEFPVFVHYGNAGRQHLLRFPRAEYTDMRRYWLDATAYDHSYAWNKVYKRSLFNGVFFPEGRLFEDMFMLPMLLARCHRVATTDVGLYLYYDNVRGITHNADAHAYGDLLEAHCRVLSRWHDWRYHAAVLDIALTLHLKSGCVPDMPWLPYHRTLKQKINRYLGLKWLCRIHRLAITLLGRRS